MVNKPLILLYQLIFMRIKCSPAFFENNLLILKGMILCKAKLDNIILFLSY